MYFKIIIFSIYLNILSETQTTKGITTPIISSGCPEGWNTLSNKCFQYVNNVHIFSMDETVCKTTGQNNVNILSIHSEADQNLVMQNISGKPSPFIGLNKDETPDWIWSDRTQINYTNFGNQTSIPESFKCVIINTNSTQTGKWFKVNCYDSHPVICEIGRATIPSSSPSTKPSTTIPTTPSTLPSTRPSTTTPTTPSTLPSTRPSTTIPTTPSTSPSTKPSTTKSTTPDTSPSTKPSTSPSSIPNTIKATSSSTSPTTKPSTTKDSSPTTTIHTISTSDSACCV